MKFVLEDDANREKIIVLRLERIEDGVTLLGIDNEGAQWRIADFRNGKFELITDISEDVGIKVDAKGKIKEQK